MTITPANLNLIELAIGAVPGIAATLRSLFAKANPDAPVLTDEEIFAAYKAAFDAGISKDDLWLEQHPGPGYSTLAPGAVVAPVAVPSSPFAAPTPFMTNAQSPSTSPLGGTHGSFD